MSQNFNIEPYWDDFEAANGALENNYMRILFRPGYAVQARELTQIQSILQNQLKQFGNHMFQDGSPVSGGHLTIDTSVTYLKLDKQFGGNDIDVEEFLNLTVYNNQVPKTRARVTQTHTSSTDRTLMIKYLKGSEFGASETITTGSSSANTVATNHTGLGSTCTINDGVFYVEGYFVKVAQQTIVLDPYGTEPTYRIGLEIDERIITENQDTALLDPAQNSFNYQAPGAHRYKFNLVLAKRAIDSTDDERFFELLRVENGVVTKQVTYPIYSELEKTLARRTYDESGDYVVKPFRVHLSSNTSQLSGNADSFIINVEPGKAYVKGFEFETVGTQRITGNKARTYKDSLNYDLSVYYGNRIQLTNYAGSGDGIGFSADMEELDVHCVSANAVILNGNTHNYFSTKIGTAKLRNIDRAGVANNYFVYLTDIEFNSILGAARQDSLYLNEIYLPPHFSTVAGAYNDSIVTILSGPSAGESAIVTGYNGTSKLALLNRDFSSAIEQGDEFSIAIPLTSAESFIKPSTTFTSPRISANVARASKDAVDSAIIEDSNFNKNLFLLPNYYVRYGSDENVSLYRRLIRRAQFTANGSYSFGLSSPEEGSFDFGTNAAVVSNADVNENIIVMPVEGQFANTILDMTANGRSVYRSTEYQITINTNSANTTFYADVIVTTKLTDIENTKRVKTLRSANAEITQYDVPTTATAVVGVDDVSINLSNGVVWFASSNVINKIPGEPQSLHVSDVVKIEKIYDSGSLSYAPNTINAIDITDRYTWDSGQTDNYYDHASITLKPGALPPAGQTAVFFNHYEHSGYGYLSAASYAQTTYEAEQIPIYKSATGEIYNLRDCIDLRPIRNPGTTTNPFKTVTLSPTVNIAAGKILVTANVNRLYANVLSPPLLSGSKIRVNNEERTIANVYFEQTKGTSTSNNNIAVGTKIFTITTGADIEVSQLVRVANSASNYIEGDVVSYNSSTGELNLNATVAVGSGVYTQWDISSRPCVTVDEPFNTTSTNTNIFLVAPNKKFGNVEVYLQRPTDPLELDYSYYLPRTDLLVLTKDKEFKVIEGVPSLSPIEPTLNEDAMPIYRLNIPAYTASLNSVNLEYIDNRRYTMKDISAIDQRLKVVEEFIKLKDAEAEIINNPPKSPTSPTINKPIYGTLVDDFNDLTIADTNKDFAASIQDGKLTCYKNVTNLRLKQAPAGEFTVLPYDKFLSIGYTEVPAVQQRFATANASQQVQTGIIGKFEGFVTLTPESDYFYSTVFKPVITDVNGRDREINQPEPTSGIGAGIIGNIGGGGYIDDIYRNPPILGGGRRIVDDSDLWIPAFNNEPGQYEPVNLIRKSLTFEGTALGDYLGSEWTGVVVPTTPPTDTLPNIFTSGWLDNSSISSAGSLGIEKRSSTNINRGSP